MPIKADPQPRSSGSSDELANIHAYVTCDGAEKGRRDVSTLVERNRRHAAVRMSVFGSANHAGEPERIRDR